MTTKNQNARRRGAGGAGAAGRLRNNSGAPIVPRRAAGCNAFDALLAQAASLMLTDPERYGEHFLIWLSLYSAKHGLSREVQR